MESYCVSNYQIKMRFSFCFIYHMLDSAIILSVFNFFPSPFQTTQGVKYLLCF